MQLTVIQTELDKRIERLGLQAYQYSALGIGQFPDYKTADRLSHIQKMLRGSDITKATDIAINMITKQQ